MQRGQPRYVVSLARASSLRKRADWSRRLPRPIVIPNVMTLKTLADVRALIERHLPAGHRENRTWRHVAAELGKGCGRRRTRRRLRKATADRAVAGGRRVPAEVTAAEASGSCIDQRQQPRAL